MDVLAVRKPMARNLREFLEGEIKRHGGSIRAFAKDAGLNHETVRSLLDYTSASSKYPDIETIIKLAKVTKTDPCLILSLVLGEEQGVNTADAEDLLLTQQIKQLPDHLRQAIDVIIIGAGLSGGDKNA